MFQPVWYVGVIS